MLSTIIKVYKSKIQNTKNCIHRKMKNTSEGEASVIHVLPTGEQSNSKNSRNPIQDSSSSHTMHVVETEINRQEQNLISYWSSLYVFPILGACIIFSSTQTLIPWHNLFISPEYWWEELIRSALFYMPFRIVLPTAREAYCVFQLKEIFDPKVFEQKNFKLKFFDPIF